LPRELSLSACSNSFNLTLSVRSSICCRQRTVKQKVDFCTLFTGDGCHATRLTSFSSSSYSTGNPIFAGGLAPPAIKPLPVGFLQLLKRPINSASCCRSFRIFDLQPHLDGPDLYGALSFLETMPSRPRWQTSHHA
jgi:hypothetical protein